jgi:hypothetical protein
MPTPPDTLPGTTPQQPSQDVLSQNLDQVTASAPTLLHAPTTAVTVAGTPTNDLEQSAQATAHAQNLSALTKATQQSHDPGGIWGAFDALGHDVGHIAKDVGSGLVKLVSAPLTAAQHAFRYLVATEQQHGWGAAIGEGLAMLAGAAAVGALTGGFGDLGLAALGGEEAAGGFDLGEAASTFGRTLVSSGARARAARSGLFLGGSAAGWAVGHVSNPDLWNKTASSTWVDKNGNQVSFGRVLAGMMGLKSGGARTVLSGTLDGIFDMGFGRIPGLDQLSAAREAATPEEVSNISTGLTSNYHGQAFNTENLEYAYNNPGLYGGFHRALDYIASHNGAEIADMFPRLNSAARVSEGEGKDAAQELSNSFIRDLDQASTKEEAFDVLKNYVGASELLNGGRLPTMSLFRQGTAALRTAAEKAEAGWTLPNLQAKVRGGLQPKWAGARRALAPIVGSASVATWARRLHHLPGMQIDPTTMRAYGHAVDFVQDRVPSEVHDMLEITQGRKYADNVGQLWLNADPAARKIMLRNAHLSAIFGMFGHRLEVGQDADIALINDPKSREYLAQRMDELSGDFTPDAADRYGAYRSGRSIQPAVNPDTGRRIGAGILLSQHGKGTLMTLTELRRTADMLRAGKDLYGSMDDFLYEWATKRLFKRWVLLSSGYMNRIAAAEDVPNMLRLGVGKMVSAAAITARANLGWEIENNPEAVNGIQHFVYDLIGHLPLNQDKVNAAYELAEAYNGSTLAPLVRAGEHGSPIDDPGERLVRGLRDREAAGNQVRFGKQYEMYGPNDRWYVRQWRVWLRQIQKDPMSNAAARAMHAVYERGGSLREATQAGEQAWKDHLAGMADRDKAPYIASMYLREGDPPAWTPEQSWAFHGVQNLIAATHTPEDIADAGVHMDLLRGIAENEKLPAIRDLSRIEETRRPLGVPGREVLPDGDTRLARLATRGFRFMNQYVNMVSRHELYFNEYYKQRQILMKDVEAGILNHDQALTVAQTRSAQESTRWIHNLHDRTAWTETMRNWSPFWFAKEQAYRRMGRLLAEDPAAFRQYELMIMGAHTLTMKQQDPQGNPYVALPGEGFLSSSVLTPLAHLGLPIGKVDPVELGGDFGSTSVVFPTSGLAAQGSGMFGIGPDFGPVAIVPAKLLYGAVSAFGRRYPDFAKPAGAIQGLTQGVFGQQALNETFVNDILPNTALQRTYEALNANDSTYDTAMMLTIQTMDYEQNVAMGKWIAGGRKGPMPSIVPPLNAGYAAKQAFLSRVKNMTQMNLIARAVLSLATPVTLEMVYSNFGLPQQLQNDITKAGSVTAGMDAFLAKNPNATPYTVSESQHPGDLASLPESAQAQGWIEQNAALINQYPEAAIWLMPQALTKDPYSQTAYNEQIADGLRVKDTPQQFLDALYTAAGDQTYYAALAEHEAVINSLGQGSSTAKDAEYAKWDQYVQQLQIQQPTWFANSSIFSAQKQAQEQQTIVQLQDLLASPLAPKGKQTDLVKQVMAQYNVAAEQYAQAQVSSSYTTAIATVREQWTAYLHQMEAAYPQIAPMLKSVFSGIFYVSQG